MLVSRTSDGTVLGGAVSTDTVAVSRGQTVSPAMAPGQPTTPQAAETKGQSGRLLSLDMLRGIAIFLVLGRHRVAPPDGLGWFQPVVSGWSRIGWSGVDLFFVLSGFLVSGLLFAEYRRRQTVDVRRFVIRRGFKIWPPYLAYIGFVACWLGWKHWREGGAGVWEQLWPNLLHVQNYFHSPRLHTWSLAVEEHFYLAVAIAFGWWLRRRAIGAASARDEATRGRQLDRPPALQRDSDTAVSDRRADLDCHIIDDNPPTKSVPGSDVTAAASDRQRQGLFSWFPWFVASLVVLLAVVRTFTFLREGPAMNIYATHLRFDGLLIGTLLAYWTHFRPERLERFARRPLLLVLVGLAIAAPTLYATPEAGPWAAGVGLTAVYVGYGLILLGWLNLERTRWGRTLFRSAPAAWLGGVGFFSYSIYLWHVDLAQTPLYKLAQIAAARGVAPGVVWVLATTVYIALAIGLGRCMAKLFEAPSLALRERFFPSTVR